ncbi:uncharacterized protein PV09_06020 [Verruconis gallopava]|uniref:Enoyl reductase (ER) domain-containing protein n=1 Tax=Verruconis gallopava TaxID=253628 RepID=A0A0D2A7P8_9PEZI|nr:uncharacterized protein PV09_06020 [Verruconis gallopava]KIW02565.1 hypothetical protein PV09_06020 [Verruconis gallopava]
MKALKALGNKKAEVQDGLPIPALRPDYVTVKTMAVALNPTDWKHIGFVDDVCTIGCDFAGIVEEVGSAVSRPWKKGDRVFGFVHGGNVVHGEDGAFGEYLTAKGDLLMRIPDHMTFEDASTMGVGIITCGQGLYQQMGLPWPGTAESSRDGRQQILIYGGSSATGMHGIQFAKLSGFEVITTSSPRNFELLKSLGADYVFDYNSPSCAADIKKLTNDKLMYAWDTISAGISVQICAEALSSTGNPTYGSILVVTDFPRNDVRMTYSLGYTVVGEYFRFRAGREFAASAEDFEFGKKWVVFAEKLVAEGKIKPPRKDLRSGGLERIFDGLKDLQEGRVSGSKIVYRIGSE